MHPALAILWFLPSFVFGLGTVIVVVAMRRAPEGFETEDGFRYLHPSDGVRDTGIEHSPEGVHPTGIELA